MKPNHDETRDFQGDNWPQPPAPCIPPSPHIHSGHCSPQIHSGHCSPQIHSGHCSPQIHSDHCSPQIHSGHCSPQIHCGHCSPQIHSEHCSPHGAGPLCPGLPTCPATMSPKTQHTTHARCGCQPCGCSGQLPVMNVQMPSSSPHPSPPHPPLGFHAVMNRHNSSRGRHGRHRDTSSRGGWGRQHRG
jgi:hypothetical protein